MYKFNNNAQIVWQKSVFDEIGYIKSIRPFDKDGGEVMIGGMKKATSFNYDGSTYGYVYELDSMANGVYIYPIKEGKQLKQIMLYIVKNHQVYIHIHIDGRIILAKDQFQAMVF